MCIVAEKAVIGPAAFSCAQSGCRGCQERLMRRHEGLVHAVIRRSWFGSSEYDGLGFAEKVRSEVWRKRR